MRPNDKCKGTKMVSNRKYLGSILHYFNDSGKSIFDHKYHLEFKFTIEKVYSNCINGRRQTDLNKKSKTPISLVSPLKGPARQIAIEKNRGKFFRLVSRSTLFICQEMLYL